MKAQPALPPAEPNADPLNIEIDWFYFTKESSVQRMSELACWITDSLVKRCPVLCL
jgi:hypothetical protein